MNKLKIKDVMLIGIYGALYFICVGLGTLAGVLFIHSGNMMFAPAFTALFAGTVYMLLIAKVKKFGAITLLGLIMATFFFFSGHYLLSFFPSVICGVGADVIAKQRQYQSKIGNLLSYIVFSLGNLGPIILMWFMKEAYIQRLLNKGKDWTYIHNVMVDFTGHNVAFLLFAICLSALVGGLFGQYMMRKHFIRSGMVK